MRHRACGHAAAHRPDGDARLEGLVPPGPVLRSRHPSERRRRHCGNARGGGRPPVRAHRARVAARPNRATAASRWVRPTESWSASVRLPGHWSGVSIGIARSESPLLGVGLVAGGAVQLEGFHAVALTADDLPRNASAYSSIDALILDAPTLACSRSTPTRRAARARRGMWPHRGAEHRCPSTPPAGRRGRMQRPIADERGIAGGRHGLLKSSLSHEPAQADGARRHRRARRGRTIPSGIGWPWPWPCTSPRRCWC